jgi:hypothetical protein
MSRVYLRQKMAANVKIFVGVMFIGFIFILFSTLYNDGFSNSRGLWSGVFAYAVVETPISICLIYADKGYRVSYDDKAIYQRPHGLTLKLGFQPEQMMRYDDIELVYGDPGRLINFGIMPFEFIRLIRKDGDHNELFMISPFFLYHEEMKALIWKIHEKRPDAFAQEVIDYLNSDQRL